MPEWSPSGQEHCGRPFNSTLTNRSAQAYYPYVTMACPSLNQQFSAETPIGLAGSGNKLVIMGMLSIASYWISDFW